MANRDQVNNIYKGVLMRDGDSGGLNHFTGKDANFIVADMLNSQERKNLEASIQNTRNQVAQMQNSINQLTQTLGKITLERDEATKAGTATKEQLQALMVKEQAQLAQIADCVAELDTANKEIQELEKNGYTEADRQDQKKILALVQSIFNYFAGQFKTFQRYRKDK